MEEKELVSLALSVAALAGAIGSLVAEWRRRRRLRLEDEEAGLDPARLPANVDVIDPRCVSLLDERVFALDVDLPVVVEVFVRSFHDGTQKAFLRCKPDDRTNGLLAEKVGGKDPEAENPAGLEDGGQSGCLEGPVAVSDRGNVVYPVPAIGRPSEPDERDADGTSAKGDDFEDKRFRATVSVVDRPQTGLDVVVVVDPVADKRKDAGCAAYDADKSADDADPGGEGLKCGLGFHAADSSTGATGCHPRAKREHDA